MVGYETVGRPSTLSACPSIRPISRPPHVAAAGLLLWARRAGVIDRLLHGRGAEQQLRAVSRCQLTSEAEHRLVLYCAEHDRELRVVDDDVSGVASNLRDSWCVTTLFSRLSAPFS